MRGCGRWAWHDSPNNECFSSLVDSCLNQFQTCLASISVFLSSNLMSPDPSDGEVFLKEASLLQERRKSLLGVELLPELVTPAKKMTTITYAIMQYTLKPGL